MRQPSEGPPICPPIPTPSCGACGGEGFVDAGGDARPCGRCGGTGYTAPIASVIAAGLRDRVPPTPEQEALLAQCEMVEQAFGVLARVRPLNRRLGRRATREEVEACYRKVRSIFDLAVAMAFPVDGDSENPFGETS